MSLVLVLAPPALLVTSVVSVQVSPTFAPPLTRGKMLPITPWICAMKRLPRGVASRFFTRPLWSTKPWITPPFALSTDSGPIGSVPSYLAESTTTCITRPPVVSLRVTTTHAVRPRLCSWGAWPNAVRSTVVWFLASIRYFIVAGGGGGGGGGGGAAPAGRERGEYCGTERHGTLRWKSMAEPPASLAGRRGHGSGRKPSSVSCARAQEMVICLGWPSPATSSSLPAASGAPLGSAGLVGAGRTSPPIWPCSDWGLPCRSLLPGARGALTPPFPPSPSPASRPARGGLFSVALSVASRR